MHRPVLATDEIEAVARRFKLSGVPVHLELLSLLEETVGEIVEATGYWQANVSKQLSTMPEEGLLARRRDGVPMYDDNDDPALRALCLLVRIRLREETGH